ncbi:MAG: PAP2 family protein [Flavobacterium psychrophilum]|nr:MAG: PAP2 family protein [Flavobacterium psychrophilum]
MKCIVSTLVVGLLFIGNLTFAQFNLRTQKQSSLTVENCLLPKAPFLKSRGLQKAFAVPLLFTAAGLYSITDNDLINKLEVQEERNELIPKFRSHIDDYLQYAPIAAVYGLNAIGIKGKNNFGNRTAILIKSELLVGILTYSLKKITAVPRPDTGQPTSFPSGHTAQAFAAATFMAKEYGHKSIWYSIGAYTVATGIGTMRVMNNRHWVSDVLVGAGIGILSTNLVYLTHQYKWGKKKSSGQTLIIPSYDGQTGMVNVVHRFR